MEVLINRPNNERDIMRDFADELSRQHKTLGKERLLNQMDIICLEFAQEHGYLFAKDGERIVFTHNSLDEKDFLNN